MVQAFLAPSRHERESAAARHEYVYNRRDVGAFDPALVFITLTQTASVARRIFPPRAAARFILSVQYK